MMLCYMWLMQARVMANHPCDVNIIDKCHCVLICHCISMLYIIMSNIMQLLIIVMIMCMNDILMLMIVMDIIPNYNYFILFHFRAVCIHLYPTVSICIWCICCLLMWCDACILQCCYDVLMSINVLFHEVVAPLCVTLGLPYPLNSGRPQTQS